MKNRGILFAFVLSILSINFVSAAFHYGRYDFRNLLYNIDPLILLFLIFFGLIFFALSKFFKDKIGIAFVVSLSISLLIIWSMNSTGFNFEGFLYNLGFSSGVLFFLVPLLLLGGLIFAVVRYGFGVALTILGAFFWVLALVPDVYSKDTAFIIGLILTSIGIYIWSKQGIKKRFDAWGRPL